MYVWREKKAAKAWFLCFLVSSSHEGWFVLCGRKVAVDKKRELASRRWVEAVQTAVMVSDHGEAKNDGWRNGGVDDDDDGWCEKGRGTGGERERQCILLLCLLLLVVVVAVSTGTL